MVGRIVSVGPLIKGDNFMIDEGKLNQFIGQILGDLGGAASVALVRMGDALGLYRTLHEKGAMTCRRARQRGEGRRALSARMALASGGLQLSELRGRQRQVRAATRAGHGVRDRGQPGLHDGRLRFDRGADGEPVQGPAGVQARGRRRLGRSGGMPVLRHRALLPPGLPEQSGAALAAGAGRCGGEARARRDRSPMSAAAMAGRPC